jgi:hypothetical protein
MRDVRLAMRWVGGNVAQRQGGVFRVAAGCPVGDA